MPELAAMYVPPKPKAAPASTVTPPAIVPPPARLIVPVFTSTVPVLLWLNATALVTPLVPVPPVLANDPWLETVPPDGVPPLPLMLASVVMAKLAPASLSSVPPLETYRPCEL